MALGHGEIIHGLADVLDALGPGQHLGNHFPANASLNAAGIVGRTGSIRIEGAEKLLQ